MLPNHQVEEDQVMEEVAVAVVVTVVKVEGSGGGGGGSDGGGGDKGGSNGGGDSSKGFSDSGGSDSKSSDSKSSDGVGTTSSGTPKDDGNIVDRSTEGGGGATGITPNPNENGFINKDGPQTPSNDHPVFNGPPIENCGGGAFK